MAEDAEPGFFSGDVLAGRKKIIASVVQTCSVKYSVEDTLKKLEDLVTQGKERDGTQLMVFPEALLVWDELCSEVLLTLLLALADIPSSQLSALSSVTMFPPSSEDD